MLHSLALLCRQDRRNWSLRKRNAAKATMLRPSTTIAEMRSATDRHSRRYRQPGRVPGSTNPLALSIMPSAASIAVRWTPEQVRADEGKNGSFDKEQDWNS